MCKLLETRCYGQAREHVSVLLGELLLKEGIFDLRFLENSVTVINDVNAYPEWNGDGGVNSAHQHGQSPLRFCTGEW